MDDVMSDILMSYEEKIIRERGKGLIIIAGVVLVEPWVKGGRWIVM